MRVLAIRSVACLIVLILTHTFSLAHLTLD